MSIVVNSIYCFTALSLSCRWANNHDGFKFTLVAIYHCPAKFNPLCHGEFKITNNLFDFKYFDLIFIFLYREIKTINYNWYF